MTSPLVQRVAVTLCSMLVFAIGCERSSNKAPSSDEPPPSLVDPGEEKALLSRLDAEVAKNREQRCPRPPLRGKPSPGRADQDILSALDEDGPLAGCYQAIDKVSAPADELGAWIREAAPLAKKTPATLGELEKECAPLADRVSRAVAHRDACSPFLPGRRGQIDLLPMIKLAKAGIVLARVRARSGHPKSGAELLFDLIRLGQDLSRGGSSLVEPMLATAALRLMLPHLSAILDAKTLDDQDLEALGDQLDALLASQVPATRFHRAEWLNMTLYHVRPELEKPGWTPPGGFPFDLAPRKEAQKPGERIGVEYTGPHVRMGLLLTLVASEQLAARLAKACPDDGTWKSCIAKLEAARDQLAEETAIFGPTKLVDLLGKDPEQLRAEDVRQMVRRHVIARLQSESASALPRYFRRMAWNAAALLAARAKVRARLGDCPGKPPRGNLGAQLELVTTSDGQHQLLAPEFARYHSSETGDSAADRELLSIRCR